MTEFQRLGDAVLTLKGKAWQILGILESSVLLMPWCMNRSAPWSKISGRVQGLVSVCQDGRALVRLWLGAACAHPWTHVLDVVA